MNLQIAQQNGSTGVFTIHTKSENKLSQISKQQGNHRSIQISKLKSIVPAPKIEIASKLYQTFSNDRDTSRRKYLTKSSRVR